MQNTNPSTTSASSNQADIQTKQRHAYILQTNDPRDWEDGVCCAYSTQAKAEKAAQEYRDEYAPDSAKVVSIPLY